MYSCSASAALVRRLAVFTLSLAIINSAIANPDEWREEWPNTDFSRSTIAFAEILSGGPPRDGIPALTHPRFENANANRALPATEPVIVVVDGASARAYPLRILMWHEIVNDVINGRPIAVTYCPLCNASIVYDRRAARDNGKIVLSFGVSGKLRHSDMVMFDRETESWWQQFTGNAIVGSMTGYSLRRIRSETLPYAEFVARHPDGLVLAEPDDQQRRYGFNPYERYDGLRWPFLYTGRYAEATPPLAYVVVVGRDAWPLEMVRKSGRIRHGDIQIEWSKGMNSALDAPVIAESRELGFVVVRRIAGREKPLPYDVTFAFAFKAFMPTGTIHQAPPALN